MLVKDAMNEKVITIEPNATVREAAKIMTKYRIGSLLVMEDEKLLGIVTELDILWKVVAEGRDLSEFIKWLHKGPPGAVVEKVEIVYEKEEGLKGFVIVIGKEN